MTPNEFQAARHRIGLSTAELAAICNVQKRAIESWEQTPGVGGSRAPNPIAVRVLEWIESGALNLKKVKTDGR